MTAQSKWIFARQTDLQESERRIFTLRLHILRRILGFVCLLALWQAMAVILRSPLIVGAPQIGKAFVRMTLSGELLLDAGVSLLEIVVGFLLAGSLGLSMAIWIYEDKAIETLVTPVLDFIRSIPALALVPIIVLLFGIGLLPKVLIVLWNAYPPCLLSSLQALREADRDAKEAAALDGANRWQALTRIAIPIAVPSILTGFRAGMGNAWLALIGAELLGSQAGLGTAVIVYTNAFSFPEVYASVLAIALMGLAINTAMMKLQNLLDYTKEK